MNLAKSYHVCIVRTYLKSSIKPPGRAYSFHTFEGGGGGGTLQRLGGLFERGHIYIQFSIEDDVNSPQRARMQSGKAQVQEVGDHTAEDQKQLPVGE